MGRLCLWGHRELPACLQDAEEFFVVKWAVLQTTGAPLLLAAGRLGVVRVLDCHDQSLLWASLSSILSDPLQRCFSDGFLACFRPGL